MVTEEEKPKYKISKTVIKKGVNGMIMEQQSLEIEGDDFDKVKKVFEEKWQK